MPRSEALHPNASAETDLPLPRPFVSFHRYYINLCQKIYKGPLDCSDRASICKKSASGDVQVLGLVHTQRLDVIGEAWTPGRSQAPWLGGGGRQHAEAPSESCPSGGEVPRLAGACAGIPVGLQSSHTGTRSG